MPLDIVQDGHLGGYARATPEHPHGDPDSWFPVLWGWLIGRYQIKSMLDVGCGEGHAVKWFSDRGVESTGLEGCQKAIDASPVRSRLWQIDFTQGPPRLVGYELVWSAEFVEHVEEQYIGNILEAFRFGRVLAMTHGLPDQAGWHHVNNQPDGYWIMRMQEAGFLYDHNATVESRRIEPTGHWVRSGLIFTRRML